MTLSNVLKQLGEAPGPSDSGHPDARFARSVRGLDAASHDVSTCNDKELESEMRGLRGFLLPRACARARARTVEPGRETSQTSQTSHVGPPTGPATVLRHCRCLDCRLLDRNDGGCDVPGRNDAPDEWHYCAGYDGPQISRDVLVWRAALDGRPRGATEAKGEP